MIQIDLSKCTGCKRCETTCAFSHTEKVNSNLARIKVLNLYEIGIDGPIVCQQCQERYCMACPVDALSIGSKGQIVLSPTLCTLCGACERNCPIGAIETFDESVYVCDLCGGDPVCAKFCPTKALEFATEPSPDPPPGAKARVVPPLPWEVQQKVEQK